MRQRIAASWSECIPSLGGTGHRRSSFSASVRSGAIAASLVLFTPAAFNAWSLVVYFAYFSRVEARLRGQETGLPATAPPPSGAPAVSSPLGSIRPE